MRNWLRNVAYAAVILWAITGIVHNVNRPAQAQIGGQSIVATAGSESKFQAITAGGDVYEVYAYTDQAFRASYRGNVFSGSGPITVTPSTWSNIKTLGR